MHLAFIVQATDKRKAIKDCEQLKKTVHDKVFQLRDENIQIEKPNSAQDYHNSIQGCCCWLERQLLMNGERLFRSLESAGLIFLDSKAFPEVHIYCRYVYGCLTESEAN